MTFPKVSQILELFLLTKLLLLRLPYSGQPVYMSTRTNKYFRRLSSPPPAPPFSCQFGKVYLLILSRYLPSVVWRLFFFFLYPSKLNFILCLDYSYNIFHTSWWLASIVSTVFLLIADICKCFNKFSVPQCKELCSFFTRL